MAGWRGVAQSSQIPRLIVDFYCFPSALLINLLCYEVAEDFHHRAKTLSSAALDEMMNCKILIWLRSVELSESENFESRVFNLDYGVSGKDQRGRRNCEKRKENHE